MYVCMYVYIYIYNYITIVSLMPGACSYICPGPKTIPFSFTYVAMHT